MTRSLARIRGSIGRERAEMLIASVAGGWTPRTEACLFYPYFWFLFRCSSSNLVLVKPRPTDSRSVTWPTL